MIDAYGRNISYMRISVTELCNLRCRYCMPEQGVPKKQHQDIISEDEIIAVIEAAASLGVNKIRITGGEPLVKKNILSICRRTAAVPGIEEVCLTTNGLLLPELAPALRAAGVDRINISLDTLDPEKYAHMTRRGDLQQALAGLDAALAGGFSRVKVNTVLIGGFNDNEIPALAALTQQHDLDLRFIELMPMSAEEGFGPSCFVPLSRVLEVLPEARPEPEEPGVAKLYRLPGAKGRIGLITPLSDLFCHQCNRLRLTADGKLKPCLHGAAEFPVRGLDIEAIREQLKRAILAKPQRHAELSAQHPSEAGRDMNQIGG